MRKIGTYSNGTRTIDVYYNEMDGGYYALENGASLNYALQASSDKPMRSMGVTMVLCLLEDHGFVEVVAASDKAVFNN